MAEYRVSFYALFDCIFYAKLAKEKGNGKEREHSASGSDFLSAPCGDSGGYGLLVSDGLAGGKAAAGGPGQLGERDRRRLSGGAGGGQSGKPPLPGEKQAGKLPVNRGQSGRTDFVSGRFGRWCARCPGDEKTDCQPGRNVL